MFGNRGTSFCCFLRAEKPVFPNHIFLSVIHNKYMKMTLTALKAQDLPVEFKRLSSKPLNEVAQGIKIVDDKVH